MKQVFKAGVLLTSIVAVQAAGKIFGATTTGMVDPKKRRHIERALNIEGDSAPGHRGASHRDLSAERDLLYNEYYSNMPPPDYYQKGIYYPPKYPPQYPPKMPPKGMGMGMGGKGMGMGGGKKGYPGGGGPNYPIYPPPVPVPDCKTDKYLIQNPFTDDWMYICDDDDCEMLIESAELRIPYTLDFVEADSTTSIEIGTTYIFAANLQDGTGNTLSSMVYGTCTRTTTGGTISSEAVCTWVIIDDAFDQVTITGQLSGSGGNLVVTGGSGSWAGTIGDATVIPVALGNGDLLDDALYYTTTLTLGYIVCPAQNPPDVS